MNSENTIRNLFSFQDILYVKTVSNGQLSKAGQYILCVVTSSGKDTYHDDIVLINNSTYSQPKIASGSSPQWNPKGTQIAYIGDNKGQPGIFIFDLNMNSSQLLVNIYESHYFIDHYAKNNFCWSPNGKSIAYVSAPFKDLPTFGWQIFLTKNHGLFSVVRTMNVLYPFHLMEAGIKT